MRQKEETGFVGKSRVGWEMKGGEVTASERRNAAQK
jgi:hypothetical protein